MRSAIFSSALARSAAGVRPHASAAAWAASRASSMSSAPERAALVNDLPVIGVMTSKYYWPFTGGTNLPPMKLS